MKQPSETTDLERRVLAHERVLQALIAYLARTDSRFIDHLKVRFVEPMQMVQHEHDYRDTDDYAAEFIRVVMSLGNQREQRLAAAEPTGTPASLHEEQELPVPSAGVSEQTGRVQVRERSGIWELRVDGVFRGDYHQKEHAEEAASLLRISPP